MNRKGINYDTGIPTTHGALTRETFDPQIVRREIEIIKNDLRCTAIRISGERMDRLSMAGEYALQQGLEVWFSPSLQNATPSDTLSYLAEAAQAAEKLRQQSPQVVFIMGVEMSAFMQGLLEGDTPMERLGALMNPLKLIKSTIFKGSFHKNLNNFFSKAVPLVRSHFNGPITYASGTWENVDWAPFDFVGVDAYRDNFNKKVYEENLRAYFKQDKPVVITEFGCCTYQGAQDKGGYGWAIVDWKTTPPQLKGDYERDEAGQANYIVELLDIFEQEQAEGAFVFTFVMPSYPYHEDKLRDLDMASYGVVKSYDDRQGTTYPDMPWEPKEAFFKLADYYATH